MISQHTDYDAPKLLAKCNANTHAQTKPHFCPSHFVLVCPRLMLQRLAQPDPPKQQYDRREETNPHFPPHTRTLCHPQHPVHRASQLQSRVLKLIVHLLGEGGRVADFVTNEVG
jgi:hypothetical protein